MATAGKEGRCGSDKGSQVYVASAATEAGSSVSDITDNVSQAASQSTQDFDFELSANQSLSEFVNAVAEEVTPHFHSLSATVSHAASTPQRAGGTTEDVGSSAKITHNDVNNVAACVSGNVPEGPLASVNQPSSDLISTVADEAAGHSGSDSCTLVGNVYK